MRRLVVLLALIAAACTAAASDTVPDGTSGDSSSSTAAGAINSTTSTSADTDSSDEGSSSTPSPAPRSSADSSCEVSGEAQPWTTQMVSTAELVLEDNGVEVEAVVYPRPDYRGKPWSQWGQGIVTGDGRFISAIGDHHGVDGNSFLYEYDLDSRNLTMFADLGEVIGHVPGSWGYGKVHAQMVEGPCGIYVSTYWGTRRNLVLDDNYRGDHLLLVDPWAKTITDMSLVLDGFGVASMASSPADGLIYAEPVDATVQPKEGPFLVLDQAGNEIFRSEGDHEGFRAVAVDSTGRAYYSTGSGRLARYDPATNSAEELDVELPGDLLRAATVPAPDGTIFGVTRSPATFFSLSPTGDIDVLAEARGYTTSMALAPDGESFFYVPHAHGGSAREGTPLLSVDTATGQEEVVVLLNEAIEQRFGLTLGGTYNIVMSEDGSTVFLGMNAGEAGSDSTFGEVVLLIIHLQP